MTTSDSPYAPPAADLSGGAGEREPVYFSVGARKLALMSICTGGLYELYWCYRNWQCIKRNDGSDIWPIARALFAPLFGFALAKSVRDHALALDLPVQLSVTGIGLGYLMLSIMVQLPDPWWLFSVLTFAPLVTIQGAADDVLAATGTANDEYRRFSPWNWVALVLGPTLWGITILSVFMDA
jgi:hypothetical protein